MALPKLETPTYMMERPSTGNEIKYRPFLVKEEKILLLAMEENSAAATHQAVLDLVNACTFGEIGAGIGIIIGGLMGLKYFVGLGDLITRFSGITMACIVTGVIWISYSPDLMTVLLYDYLHVSLYFVGIYFALAGNSS